MKIPKRQPGDYFIYDLIITLCLSMSAACFITAFIRFTT